MWYTSYYASPFGRILLSCDETGLTGLWFDGAKYYAAGLDPAHEQRDTPVFQAARRWLDIYFSGHEPEFSLPVHMIGTPFQIAVWDILRRIPYGKTAAYGEVAARIAFRQGLERMSARAVGGAVGRNRICLLIPCHRVVGTGGRLTGYAGGLERKRALLKLEGAEVLDDRQIFLSNQSP